MTPVQPQTSYSESQRKNSFSPYIAQESLPPMSLADALPDLTALAPDELRARVQTALAPYDWRGCRVLVIIPDTTRNCPTALLARLLVEQLGRAASTIDFLVALGTHSALSDEALAQLVGFDALMGLRPSAALHLYNHEWWQPDMFYTAGVIPRAELHALSGGLLDMDAPVRLNRRVLDYDRLIIVGPVIPHEVAGFSGGSKYLFPGIAGAEIINLTHWLGALHTSSAIIGTRDTPVRRVIERAASLVRTPQLGFSLVMSGQDIVGLYSGDVYAAWQQAADHSARVHITHLARPLRRALAVMPPRYPDLWTGAKGIYKLEPALADGGEVILYAPHIDELSHVHGALIDRVGYHVRDYFTKQWNRFRDIPWGILAHSTHVRGRGEYDAVSGVETPRIRVTLATRIPPARCAQVNLGYLDPASIDLAAWRADQLDDVLFIEKAGEQLYRAGV